MSFEGFVTTYRTDDGTVHFYFFPGKDSSGHVLSKLHFITKDIDYMYTRQSDGAIDYIIKHAPKTIEYRLQDAQTGKIQECAIAL